MADQSMDGLGPALPEEAVAIELRCGPMHLILGNEVGITAAEIVTTDDQTRLELRDLPGVKTCFDAVDTTSGFHDALFVVGSEPDAPTDISREAEFHGIEGAPIPLTMQGFSSSLRIGMLAEAAMAAWRQRLSDAADILDPLTTNDAEIIGRLSIPGRPLITELLAERRRSANTSGSYSPQSEESIAVVDHVVANLHAAVRYGAAGLLDTSDDSALNSVEIACQRGEWVDRLALLIAAEEILAIDSLATCSRELISPHSTPEMTQTFEHLLAKYSDQRRRAEELSGLLDEAVDRLPSYSRNLATRLLRRNAIDDVKKLRDTAEAYSSIVRIPRSPQNDTRTWTATTQALLALERAAAYDQDGDDLTDGQSTRSITDAAEALGGLFKDQLPAARALVDDIASQHPGVEAEGRVEIIKRGAMRKLKGEFQQGLPPQSIPEVVAELTMAIALVRGFQLRTDAEFHALGLRLLTRAERIAKIQERAGHALPLVSNGFNVFVLRIQPLMAEHLFHRLGGMKPSRPGAARNAYKTARSKVWRARHDRDITEAAVGGAADALQRAIDAGAPRLIVRYVDRSLPPPKR